ncbi:MAG TPA: hypothetical protein VIM62_07925 [Acidobacteriaceae bacterium]
MQSLCSICLLVLLGLACLPAGAASKTGFTVKASNVSISDHGSGTSTVTITSVNGYTSTKIQVECDGGPSGGIQGYVYPVCTSAQTLETLPANGSVEVPLQLTPPPGVNGNAAPMVAAGMGALVFAGVSVRRRSRWNSLTTVILLGAGAAVCLCGTGCGGHGGLVMTPGTYTYGVRVTAPDVPAGVIQSFTVHVQDPG